MDLNDRLVYLLIGVGIGFILGYITKSLRKIEEELHEVDITTKKIKSEDGFVRFPIFANLALVTVLFIAVWASFSAEKNDRALVATQDQLIEQQNQIERVTACNQMYLEKTVLALNERTTYSSDRIEDNVDLVNAQAVLLRALLKEPPPGNAEIRQALRSYFDPTVLNFIDTSEKSLDTFEANEYPTIKQIDNCLSSTD